MTIMYWCAFAAGVLVGMMLLPLVAALIAAYYRHKKKAGE